MTNTQITELADRYVAAWNELDQATRRSLVRQLYASNSRLVAASSDCNGLEEIVSHVDRVVTSFVGADNHRFRLAGAIGHHDWVLLRWEMVLSKTDAVADWGINVLVVDAAQRIGADAQFVAPTWDD
jgi:hypothetical protein